MTTDQYEGRYAGKTPEESGKFYGQAHAWLDIITETVDDHLATEWLEAYDHATEQWEYDMPNPLDVWEEFYTRTTTGDHTHTHDHTRAQARTRTGAYAWARAYASAYRDTTAKLMRDIIEKGYVEPQETLDNNSMTSGYGT